jgi:hypothetical protein
MEYIRILSGGEEPLPVFSTLLPALEDVRLFPDLIEPIYREAIALDEPALDRLRFGLLRVQIYADIHRNEDMERAQKLKYVGQVLEKVIFGSLLMEHEGISGSMPDE